MLTRDDLIDIVIAALEKVSGAAKAVARPWKRTAQPGAFSCPNTTSRRG
ncbi:MAG: hypothetical protein M0D55_01475 [Elusimicrobiota bacterium]|nr:MAG: hypothetical protein M0D55_01475 [Elusimicrobiota bacterium]